jgi:TonB family protein
VLPRQEVNGMLLRSTRCVVFAIALVVPAIAAARPAQSPDLKTQATPWPPAGVERPGQGIQDPQLVKDTKPAYTEGALNAGIEGIVQVEAVVRADGTVGDVRIVKSLDKEYGLDQAAIDAVKGWQFKPGRKDGQAVPVLVSIDLSFKVRSSR